MDLATRFRELRVRVGLNKTALARPRYTVSYVSQIESGRRTPSPEAMEFFAERLGVTDRLQEPGILDGLDTDLGYIFEEARQAQLARDLNRVEQIMREFAAQAEQYTMDHLHAR